MNFCPNCGSLLLLETHNTQRFFCKICPYVMDIKKEIVTVKSFKQKEKDVLRGGSAEWDNASKTESTCCPYCEHNVAYFIQIQIRSADEPATTFYKCAMCQKTWSDNN